MEIIRNWLKSGSYEGGVAIYQQHGSDPKLKKLLSTESWSEFKEKKLRESLKLLLSPAALVSVPEPEQTLQRNPLTASHGWPDERDEVLEALWQKWKPKYSEMMAAQSRAYEVALLAKKENDPTKKIESCTLVHLIMDLDDQCDSLYSQRDYYLKNRLLPEIEKEEEVVGDPVRWATNLANAQRYVRYYRNQLKKFPAKTKAAQALKKYQAEISKYKALLKIEE